MHEFFGPILFSTLKDDFCAKGLDGLFSRVRAKWWVDSDIRGCVFPVLGTKFPKTPPKTNMTMEQQPLEDVSPIKYGDVPMSS